RSPPAAGLRPRQRNPRILPPRIPLPPAEDVSLPPRATSTACLKCRQSSGDYSRRRFGNERCRRRRWRRCGQRLIEIRREKTKVYGVHGPVIIEVPIAPALADLTEILRDKSKINRVHGSIEIGIAGVSVA